MHASLLELGRAACVKGSSQRERERERGREREVKVKERERERLTDVRRSLRTVARRGRRKCREPTEACLLTATVGWL
jgi:hypothetical protein